MRVSCFVGRQNIMQQTMAREQSAEPAACWTLDDDGDD
jgi:hypothetical protein